MKIAELGSMVGMNACISGRAYEATLKTLQPSQLAFVAREDFVRFLSHHPDACLQAARHVARDCLSAYEMISVGLCQTVPKKLARILMQASTDASVVDGTLRVRLVWSHEDLAQLIGTSRETVTRTLSDFKKQCILDVSGSTVFIRNKAALEKLVAS